MIDPLKIMTCGSVDDGKSTLIGHLLYDAKLLYADQQDALAAESAGRRSDSALDYSLLLDGLIAEREQGITIDVAYRYFSTKSRSFIVADTPGHEEYTRNMAVGASFADLAVILIDAQRGVLIQTKRHFKICAMMGIRHYVFAINKMDQVGYDEAVFDQIRQQIEDLTKDQVTDTIAIIPVSATCGDNLTTPSGNMTWYHGACLLSYLETIDISESQEEGFVLSIQRVSLPMSSRNESSPEGPATHPLRQYQGEVAAGDIRIGDTVTVWPNRLQAEVSSILVAGEPRDTAGRGMAVSVSLKEDVDISRGSVLTKDTSPEHGSLFESTLLWLDDDPLIEGRSYRLELGTQAISATAMKLKYVDHLESGEKLYSKQLSKNEFGCVDLVCADTLVYSAFHAHPDLGRFILIDKVTHHTVACGTISHPLRRSYHLTRYETDITRTARAASLRQTPRTLWFTGLSASGKSTLANALEQRLAARGLHTMLLDGDNVRLGLNKDLGFTEKDRVENIRRIAEVARLFNDAGLIVLSSFIAPFAADRQMARQIIGEEDFVEIYVSTPLVTCEKRDQKGLYKKARQGIIPNFTGINSPYEPPTHPDITIDTSKLSVEEAADMLFDALKPHLGL